MPLDFDVFPAFATYFAATLASFSRTTHRQASSVIRDCFLLLFLIYSCYSSGLQNSHNTLPYCIYISGYHKRIFIIEHYIVDYAATLVLAFILLMF